MEIEEILLTYSNYDLLTRKGYLVFYPKISKDLEKALIENPRDKKLLMQLKEEFRPIFQREKLVYELILDKIKHNWEAIELNFFKELRALHLDTDTKETKCYISHYGPGGSFFPPNKVIIRAVDKYDRDISSANEKIAHEIVHLAINKLAKKYKLGFENTERLVDLILTKTPIAKLLDNPTMQGFGDEKLDGKFKAAYPNIKEIFSDTIT